MFFSINIAKKIHFENFKPYNQKIKFYADKALQHCYQNKDYNKLRRLTVTAQESVATYHIALK